MKFKNKYELAKMILKCHKKGWLLENTEPYGISVRFAETSHTPFRASWDAYHKNVWKITKPEKTIVDGPLEWKVKDEGEMTWDEAMALELSDGWRIPTIQELLTLVDYSKYSPALWGRFSKFTNVDSSGYWSASSNANNSDYVWLVYFGNGNSSYYGKSNYSHVRLVRSIKDDKQ